MQQQDLQQSQAGGNPPVQQAQQDQQPGQQQAQQQQAGAQQPATMSTFAVSPGCVYAGTPLNLETPVGLKIWERGVEKLSSVWKVDSN